MKEPLQYTKKQAVYVQVVIQLLQNSYSIGDAILGAKQAASEIKKL